MGLKKICPILSVKVALVRLVGIYPSPASLGRRLEVGLKQRSLCAARRVSMREIEAGVPNNGLYELNVTASSLRVVPPLCEPLIPGGRLYEAVKEIGGSFDRGKAALGRYYDETSPISLVDVLPELEGFVTPEIARLDPLSACLPWEGVPGGYVRWRRQVFEQDDARKIIGGCGLGSEHGSKYFGPVSSEKLNLEASRYAFLYEKLSKTRKDSVEVSGFVLVSSNEVVGVVHSGHHRAVVASVLGLPVRFRFWGWNIVRSSGVGEWPQVRRGMVGGAAALKLFGRVLNG